MPGDATRLHIFGEDFTEIELNHVRSILDEIGFGISDESYETTILSKAFPDDEASLADVDQVESKLREWFPEREISRGEVYNEIAGSQCVSYVIDIYVRKAN